MALSREWLSPSLHGGKVAGGRPPGGGLGGVFKKFDRLRLLFDKASMSGRCVVVYCTEHTAWASEGVDLTDVRAAALVHGTEFLRKLRRGKNKPGGEVAAKNIKADLEILGTERGFIESARVTSVGM